MSTPSASLAPKQAVKVHTAALSTQEKEQAQAIGRALATIPYITSHDVRVLASSIATRHVNAVGTGMQSADATNLRSDFETVVREAFEKEAQQ
jgi:hypothetical protein